MSYSRTELVERMMQTTRILAGLTPEQADQAQAVLAQASNHEVSAIHDRRESYRLGAPLPPLPAPRPASSPRPNPADSNLVERMMLVRRILAGLSGGQVADAQPVMDRAPTAELRAILDCRRSFALGAVLPPWAGTADIDPVSPTG